MSCLIYVLVIVVLMNLLYLETSIQRFTQIHIFCFMDGNRLCTRYSDSGFNDSWDYYTTKWLHPATIFVHRQEALLHAFVISALMNFLHVWYFYIKTLLHPVMFFLRFSLPRRLIHSFMICYMMKKYWFARFIIPWTNNTDIIKSARRAYFSLLRL